MRASHAVVLIAIATVIAIACDGDGTDWQVSGGAGVQDFDGTGGGFGTLPSKLDAGTDVAKDASQAAPSKSPIPSILTIWGSGPSDVWAAGHLGAILHFDGSRWVLRDDSARKALFSIWGSAATDVWALEQDWTATTHTTQLLKHDGMRFQPVALSTEPGELASDVWGSAPDDVWMVGRVGEDSADSYGIARHFDGKTWSDAGAVGSQLTAAWGTREEMFFTGDAGDITHWVAGAWAKNAYPTEEPLIEIWGAAVDDVWAVGAADTILHYQGTDWVEVDSGTHDTSTIFQAVWGSASDDVWAVGYRGYAPSPPVGVIVHWDGTAWTLAPDPPQTLYAVWGSARDDVWAGGPSTLLHYDGASWTSVTSVDTR